MNEWERVKEDALSDRPAFPGNRGVGLGDEETSVSLCWCVGGESVRTSLPHIFQDYIPTLDWKARTISSRNIIVNEIYGRGAWSRVVHNCF